MWQVEKDVYSEIMARKCVFFIELQKVNTIQFTNNNTYELF